jgi:hypothetical protein
MTGQKLKRSVTYVSRWKKAEDLEWGRECLFSECTLLCSFNFCNILKNDIKSHQPGCEKRTSE